jgi:hypothetical protein
MKFILPVEFDDISKIPKPLDPSIVIEEIPPQTGAVHCYNGGWDNDRNKEVALDLGKQLMQDGVSITKDFVLDNWQFWGYNPPFTIPYFRRNEVWVELNGEQVDYLLEHYSAESVSREYKVESLAMEVQPLFTLQGGRNIWGVRSLILIGCFAVGLVIKSRRSQYSRL